MLVVTPSIDTTTLTSQRFEKPRSKIEREENILKPVDAICGAPSENRCFPTMSRLLVTPSWVD